MLTCKQASELISQSLDRSLTRSERWSLRFHLLICVACARFNRQLASIQAVMNKWLSDTEQDEHLQLPLQAKLRMTQALESEIAASRRRP
ncbi:MAG: hypothetical protein CVU15_09965 [Betaproteobacteria bacterium HGW-Betaproteobacteria-1]|jgi:hypothetical protein|nr:MAG: hypothetical protein CVU15_09965 [Betaproteobacteria bacterium HGW-Betaproteobacteria-1]